MKGIFRKFIWFFVFLFVLVILASTIIVTFFEKELGDKIITQVNKSLKTELSVGEFELSLFSGFPSASANLRQIKLADTKGGYLLEADNLAFHFGLFSLFGSNINIHSLLIEDGTLFVHIDKKGNTNYDIAAAASTDSSDAGGSDLGISLEEASLENIELIYSDEQSRQETKMLINDAIFSGEFSSDQFSMNSYAAIESSFVDVDGTRYLAGKALDYDARVDVDLVNGKYIFENVALGVEENVFNINGTVFSEKNGTNFDLEITSKDGNLEAITQLLPAEYLDYIGDFTSTGTFLFNTTYKGLQSVNSVPALQINFGLRDGKIKSDRLHNDLKDVSFTAWYSNGKQRTNKSTVFEIRDFKGYFNRELTEMKLKIKDLDNPFIDFELDGKLPLESVYGLLNNPAITDGDGEIEINKVQLKGLYEDMLRTNRISRVEASGEIEFDDAALTINKEELVIDRGKLNLKDNDFQIQSVKVEGAGSEFILAGDFYNLIPVLFADSLNTKRAELKFKVELNARSLDLDRLLAITDIQVAENEVSEAVFDSLKVEQTLQRERLSNLLQGSFELNIDDFNYNKIKGQNFEGSLSIDNGEALLDGDVETMDGSMNLEGKIYFEEKPRLKTNLICKDINVHKFFYQSENFGQDFLVADNLKGKLNSNISINAYFDEKGNFAYDKLRVLAGVSILDGELLGLEMLDYFSSFIKVKDLKHIKFVNMENWLEIRKGKFYLPTMFIQTNAANLTVTGEHSFENDIDYGIKVNAGQVLMNKFKKHNPLLKPQKAKKKGFFDLYYGITGTLDDYEVKADKRGIKSDFENNERRKQEIKSTLEKEFTNIKLLRTAAENWKDQTPIPEFEEVDEKEKFLDDLPSQKNTSANKTSIPEFDEGEEEEELLEFDEGGSK